MKTFNEPIPDGKLGQFDEILKFCGGRYLLNPIEAPDQYGRYRVSYQYDNCKAAMEHDLRWHRITADIKETHKTRGIKAAIRNIRNMLRFFFID